MAGIDWDQLVADCIAFTQRLIQTPSMSRAEQEIAALIAGELRQQHFDEVQIDGIGNVIGRIHGHDPALPVLVLNTHLDHVDPGDPQLWPVPPFAGEIVNGRLFGRGAVDIKGPLAVQVYSMAALLRAGERPRRDVVFTGVVQEEIGGAGAQYWVENLDYPVALVVLGEPSDNCIALGHRGLLQTWVTFSGRSVHASVPAKGENPNYALAAFLTRLQGRQNTLSAHPLLGPTTVAPTIIEVDTTSVNVTSAWTRVCLDCRTASESTASVHAFYAELAAGLPYSIEDVWQAFDRTEDETIYGYYTDPQSEVAQRARAAITAAIGREPSWCSYQFATDGRLFVPYDLPIIGYGPGEETMAHTAGESIAIAKIEEALRGYVGLLHDF